MPMLHNDTLYGQLVMIMMMTMRTRSYVCVVFFLYTIYKRVMFYFFFVLFIIVAVMLHIIYTLVRHTTQLQQRQENQFTLILFMYQYFIFKQDKHKKKQHNRIVHIKKHTKSYLLNTVICLVLSHLVKAAIA